MIHGLYLHVNSAIQFNSIQLDDSIQFDDSTQLDDATRLVSGDRGKAIVLARIESSICIELSNWSELNRRTELNRQVKWSGIVALNYMCISMYVYIYSYSSPPDFFWGVCLPTFCPAGDVCQLLA